MTNREIAAKIVAEHGWETLADAITAAMDEKDADVSERLEKRDQTIEGLNETIGRKEEQARRDGAGAGMAVAADAIDTINLAKDCRGLIDCTGEVPVVRKVLKKSTDYSSIRGGHVLVFVTDAESAAQRKEGEEHGR
jgi:hypothetical protein